MLVEDNIPGLVNVYSRWKEGDNKQINKILLGGDEYCEKVISELIWIRWRGKAVSGRWHLELRHS